MKFHRNSNIVIQENVFENIVCETAAILYRPQYVGYYFSSLHVGDQNEMVPTQSSAAVSRQEARDFLQPSFRKRRTSGGHIQYEMESESMERSVEERRRRYSARLTDILGLVANARTIIPAQSHTFQAMFTLRSEARCGYLILQASGDDFINTTNKVSGGGGRSNSGSGGGGRLTVMSIMKSCGRYGHPTVKRRSD